MEKLGHILIVDDEPAVVYTLRCILENLGYAALEATTAERAMEVLGLHSVDVVLCDLGLNGPDSGIGVLDQINESHPEVGRILLTGYAPPETVEALEAQGIPVFFKPVEMGRLLPELRRIIERKAA